MNIKVNSPYLPWTPAFIQGRDERITYAEWDFVFYMFTKKNIDSGYKRLLNTKKEPNAYDIYTKNFDSWPNQNSENS